MVADAYPRQNDNEAVVGQGIAGTKTKMLDSSGRGVSQIEAITVSGLLRKSGQKVAKVHFFEISALHSKFVNSPSQVPETGLEPALVSQPDQDIIGFFDTQEDADLFLEQRNHG